MQSKREEERENHTAELSVVVPTYNERSNIPEFLKRLEVSLQGCSWEVIFVDDDSPDGTAGFIREIARVNPRVRCIQRIGRRGLSSACVEGVMSSSASYLAVMDADCQHDETIMPRMLEELKAKVADLVVGSRYIGGGGIGTWDASRARMSRVATTLSRIVIKSELSDPMSGFFMLRREAFEPAVRNLSTIGFKILLDLVASSPTPLRLKEIPYHFRNRYAGESKLDSQAMWDYLMLLADKLIGHVVPVRFLAFAFVGLLGVVVHFTVLTVLFSVVSLPFTFSQAVATVAAMTSNYALNNVLTFRDKRLKGWSWFRGWVSFAVVCSLGALANVGIASYLFAHESFWALAAIAGILVGAVWNYAVASFYTWKK